LLICRKDGGSFERPLGKRSDGAQWARETGQWSCQNCFRTVSESDIAWSVITLKRTFSSWKQ
jgi:hypothetical protein